jgi:Ca-activated chloride channel family protein
MGKAVAAGLAAGLLGGVIGQWFFQSAVSGSGSSGAAAVWEVISRVLAWGLLGGLLGAGMSVFVPNLRWQNGFLGGCIGGLIGALGFALFTVLAGPALGRWIGAALVGFFIGMMIAWAEKAFRRFWLEVKFGEREIRTFTLGPALVAVGGDEKAATVCVRDAPARALGYYVRGSRVLCEDFSSGKTADAPPGDQRKLASALLTVRSDANATPTGASLQLLQVRQVSLLEGMPLTTEDIPGLEPQGSDGVVALVSRRPSDPKVLLLRNRSKQPWIIADGGGERTVTPGMSVELSARCQINFGQVKGTLDFSQ